MVQNKCLKPLLIIIYRYSFHIYVADQMFKKGNIMTKTKDRRTIELKFW